MSACTLTSAARTRCALRDGTPVEVRFLESDDGDAVRAVFDGLGPASRFSRYLVPKRHLTASDLQHLTAVDHHTHEAVVAFSPFDGAAIGIARIIRTRPDPDTFELAVDVVDAWQNRGVGTVLTAALVRRARELSVARLSVLMSPTNEAARGLVRSLPGPAVRVALDAYGAEYVVPLG